MKDYINKIIEGDCLEVMGALDDNSVDSIVTDPPYGLEFMGKDWDKGVPGVHFWQEMIRVLKPGGHLLSFSGTRTYHRMAVAIEDAGFEVRDMIEWVYGSGFPKSLNIGKAVDKLQGNERKKILVPTKLGNSVRRGEGEQGNTYGDVHGGFTDISKGNSEWEGWGTALKPAHEPICIARKPLSEKSVAENCLKWGTGGINIDESRVETNEVKENNSDYSDKGYWGNANPQGEKRWTGNGTNSPLGRFPANLIHDNSDEVRECFPDSKKLVKKMTGEDIEDVLGSGYEEYECNDTGAGWFEKGGRGKRQKYTDNNTNASRFFKSIIYQAKASKSERGNNNNHPTVKPIALMEYLIKMVTPKGGIVLDPFAGSGTTCIAARQLGFPYIGIEKESEYIKISNARLQQEVLAQVVLF